MSNKIITPAMVLAATPEEKAEYDAILRRRALRAIGGFVALKVAIALTFHFLGKAARNYADSLPD